MDLFTSAIRDEDLRQKGDIVAVDFGDDHGVLVVFVHEFADARRIARSIPATGIRSKDVRQFADLFEVRIARPGAAFPTRGKASTLLRLACCMVEAGLEYNCWHLPRVVKQALRQRLHAA